MFTCYVCAFMYQCGCNPPYLEVRGPLTGVKLGYRCLFLLSWFFLDHMLLLNNISPVFMNLQFIRILYVVIIYKWNPFTKYNPGVPKILQVETRA